MPPGSLFHMVDPTKVEALRAVLHSGLLKGLTTDEATGRRLVAREPETAAPKSRAP